MAKRRPDAGEHCGMRDLSGGQAARDDGRAAVGTETYRPLTKVLVIRWWSSLSRRGRYTLTGSTGNFYRPPSPRPRGMHRRRRADVTRLILYDLCTFPVF